MISEQFLQSVDSPDCPAHFSAYLKALWYDANGDWDRAHEIVQRINDQAAARIHAYLHRKEGDPGNAGYWYRIAGTQQDQNLSLQQEWEQLVQQMCDKE